ncbi:hypothetical protein ACOSP7_022276 [Xanthoceras sorbifolium]
MSGSGKKRISKWDLKEDQFLHDNVRDSAWPGKSGTSFHDKESRPGWFSPKGGGYNNGHKWSGREADDMLSSKHDLRYPSREPMPGSRGSRKDDSDDYMGNFKATTAWGGDGNYSMKMSPGLEDWRQQVRHHSPKSDWNGLRRSGSRSRSRSRSRSGSRSRSWNRSRSPVRGFRRESEVYGRSRGRSGVSAQLCKDFAVGRCRRGQHCPFSHQSSQSYEDSWESRHRKAGAPKYSAPHESREYPMRSGRSNESTDELIKERENDRRNRDASLERDSEHEPRRSGDIPCKFFAAGNCRNGKYCRFSHSSQAHTSPSRRSRDERLVRSHNLDDMEKSWNGPKYSDTDSFPHAAKLSEKNERMGVNRRSREDRWVRSNNADDMEKLWDGPKWSDADTFRGAAKLSHDQNERIGAPEPRFVDWSKDERWPHNLDQDAVHADQKAGSQEAVENKKVEALPCKMENSLVGMGVSESGGTENWLGDMEMSPDWNFGVQSSSHAMKDERAHVTQSSQSLAVRDASLLTREQEITREASGLLPDATGSMQPIIIEKSYLKQDFNQRDGGGVALPSSDKNAIGKSASPFIDLNFSANILPSQSLDQNGQSSNTVPFSSLRSVGQSQDAITSEPSRGGNITNLQNHILLQQEKLINKSDIQDGNASQFSSGIQPTQNMVRSEQLTELTNISASLVQLLGNGQQLPQLYAALNPHNVMQVPLSANTEQPVQLDAAVIGQPNQAIISQRQQQYDPLHDSIESKRLEILVSPPGFSVNSAGRTSTTDGKLDIPSNKFCMGGEPSGSDNHKTCSTEEKPKDQSQLVSQLEPGANCEISKNNIGVAAEETKRSLVEDKITQKNGAMQKTDGEGNTDEGKKSKDVKAMRAFKFALVEFVKELLKPNWKEGQISKDAYKNIVKKVVDKVTGTMQGNNIPQTQEKIDQYLSFSKPKLNKLVQAYVEKFQKG